MSRLRRTPNIGTNRIASESRESLFTLAPSDGPGRLLHVLVTSVSGAVGRFLLDLSSRSSRRNRVSNEPTTSFGVTRLKTFPEKDLVPILDAVLQELRSHNGNWIKLRKFHVNLSRREALKLLLTCARDRDLLPNSLFVTDVKRQGRDPVGGGGFADIFKGTYRGKAVAIKLLRMFGGDHTQLKKDISREALLWSLLEHPNVQPFLGISRYGKRGKGSGEGNERYGLVTPWMRQGDLMGYLRDHSWRDVSRRKMIFGIALGLLYLHSSNIIHADLRGENVLVDDSGVPRISDFGFSTVRNTYPLTTKASNAGSAGGTAQFQAPELIDPGKYDVDGQPSSQYCSGSATTRSDVYAFAMTCIQILICNLPFGKMSDLQVMYSVVNKDQRPERPNEEHGEPDDGMWALIQSCWRVHPGDRPSMKLVVANLGLDGDSTESRGLPVSEDWFGPDSL